MSVPIHRTRAGLRKAVAEWKVAGQSVAIVPTMGALHEGHLSLVTAAKEQCDRVIVTIFVNPKQFNNPDDLKNYPRTEETDARKLERFAVDAVYVPEPEEIYPSGFATTVSVSGLTDCLCGATRPGHFDGVATVVAKLFLQSAADKAFFGEKDFQQIKVVSRMAADLDIPIEVVPCPTVREEDGLAMSSRNLLLSDRARVHAPAIFEVLTDLAENLRHGARFADLKPSAEQRLLARGFTKIDYLDLRSGGDLSAQDVATEDSRLFVAAWLAGVRLIDNIAVRE